MSKGTITWIGQVECAGCTRIARGLPNAAGRIALAARGWRYQRNDGGWHCPKCREPLK